MASTRCPDVVIVGSFCSLRNPNLIPEGVLLMPLQLHVIILDVFSFPGSLAFLKSKVLSLQPLWLHFSVLIVFGLYPLRVLLTLSLGHTFFSKEFVRSLPLPVDTLQAAGRDACARRSQLFFVHLRRRGKDLFDIVSLIFVFQTLNGNINYKPRSIKIWESALLWTGGLSWCWRVIAVLCC
jgi:hypothetical protein